MYVKANCKINIGLRVVNKREDGYHNIDSLFFPVYGLYDELEIEPADAFAYEQDGIIVDCAPEDNLVVRCYRMMATKYPQIRPVHIRLTKHIPFGAGLGGGSSDAAHTAIALNELYNLGLSKAQLASDVRVLGADCPYFIYNVPCHVTGIGDIIEPVDFPLSGMRLLMIKPNVYVSTKEAYGGIVPTHTALTINPADLTPMVNDFETTVFAKHPELAAIKKRLLDAGAFYAAMSGSGSTIFALIENNAESRTDAKLRVLEEEFASVIIFNDTLR